MTYNNCETCYTECFGELNEKWVWQRYLNILYTVLGICLIIMGIVGNVLGALLASNTHALLRSIILIRKRCHNLSRLKNMLFDRSRTVRPKIVAADFTTLSNISTVRIPSQESFQSVCRDLLGKQLHFNDNTLYQQSFKYARIHDSQVLRGFDSKRFLLKWFFLVNIMNITSLIIAPVMESLAWIGPNSHKWNSYEWINYRANFHYPIFKPLIVLAIFLYILFFLNQMATVLRPHTYKRLFTINKLRIAIVLSYVYAVCWYIPSYEWLAVIPMGVNYSGQISNNEANNITQNCSSKDATKFFTYEIHQVNDTKRVYWMTYQVSCELMTKVIPFLSLFVIKGVVMWKRNVHNTSTVSFADSPFRIRESKQHLKTLVIITIEFILFILPTCLIQIIIDSLPKSTSVNSSLAYTYEFLNILEYCYVTLTFYLNLYFNKNYRAYVMKKFR